MFLGLSAEGAAEGFGVSQPEWPSSAYSYDFLRTTLLLSQYAPSKLQCPISNGLPTVNDSMVVNQPALFY